MRILNIEDNVFKHRAIYDALKNGKISNMTMERADNLEAGLRRFQEEADLQQPFDLIITDMWYSERPGSQETNCGEKLIRIAQDNGWKVPIILCSSINYRIPEILGTIYYSENEDWERELVGLVKSIR